MTRVTDIALLRYMGVVHDVDIEALRASIGARLERAARAAEQMGGGDYAVRIDQVSFIIRDGVLLTVQPKRHVRRRALDLEPRD